ncbi:MAG TPA: NAD(P)/FAD-dependent oxidoreductase [Thermohalobaculum sp.]|nr:NAD(P)/FAD-dependent oxidoreductase [Thermohalobaculum sp.]
MSGADILIIGAGFSGIAMALEARRAGFSDILILEKGGDFGGTWRENRYPGVACDIPSHLYALARYPKADWRRRYAGGAEIWDYTRGVANREGLRAVTRFSCTVTGAEWDQAARRWRVETADGQQLSARVLVPAMGPLHVPKLPDIPGLGLFAGPVLHSASWDGGIDLAGKHVAVIGAGASAGQLVPELARTAARLTVYQRSAPWVLPHFDYPVPGWLRWLYGNLPGLRRADRALTFAAQEMKHAVFRGQPLVSGLVRRIALWHMARAVRDRDMRRRLTPDYQIGCKRILLSNSWYPALMRPNVELVTEPVTELRANGVVSAEGTLRRADALVLATGFRTIDTMAGLPFRGRGGQCLGQVLRDGAGAYLGASAAGFPNLFLMLGPNTALGHNSVVLMAEAQAAHVVRLLAEMCARGIEAVEPRAEVQARYADGVQARLARMVWQTGGCTSWYKDADGRNPTLWPGTVTQFRRLARASGLSDYAAA